MADLTLGVPQRLMAELREWAQLRPTTVEEAAVEMIRIGLHQTRKQNDQPPAGLDVMHGGIRH